jgi:hypothetical protein
VGEEGRKQAVVHRNMAVIETADSQIMDRLIADPRIRPYIWLRVGQTSALIGPDSVAQVVRVLEDAGLPPHYSRCLPHPDQDR